MSATNGQTTWILTNDGGNGYTWVNGTQRLYTRAAAMAWAVRSGLVIA